MTAVIYNLTSQEEQKNEFLRDIKNRYLGQKFLYIGEGAEQFYVTKSPEDSLGNLYYDFLVSHLPKDKKIAFISLGCGNAEEEKGFLESITKKGYDISYFGVDFSEDMVNLAVKNLQDLPIKKTYVVADVLSIEFSTKIQELTKGYDLRLFVFLGGTFANHNQTNVADTLFNLLFSENDLLCLDVLGRKESTNKTLFSLFERYSSYLSIEDERRFFASPLKHMLDIDIEDGEIDLQTIDEPSIGSIAYKFGFTFNKKVVVEFDKQRLHMLPGERVHLMTIRNYELDILIQFFDEHDLKEVDMQLEDLGGGLLNPIFLFKKK